MAVYITSDPKSFFVEIPEDPDKEINITWESDVAGQKSYELQYKLRKDDVWSTCGIVETEETVCNLLDIKRYLDIDFYEIFYRIHVYYDIGGYEEPYIDPETEKEVNGFDYRAHGDSYSEAYTIIFRTGIKGTLNIYDGFGTRTFNVFGADAHLLPDVNKFEKLEIRRENDTVMVPLVPAESDLASDVKVLTDNGIKRIANDNALLQPTDIYNYGYVKVTTKENPDTYFYYNIELYRNVYDDIPLYTEGQNYKKYYGYTEYYKYGYADEPIDYFGYNNVQGYEAYDKAVGYDRYYYKYDGTETYSYIHYSYTFDDVKYLTKYSTSYKKYQFVASKFEGTYYGGVYQQGSKPPVKYYGYYYSTYIAYGYTKIDKVYYESYNTYKRTPQTVYGTTYGLAKKHKEYKYRYEVDYRPIYYDQIYYGTMYTTGEYYIYRTTKYSNYMLDPDSYYYYIYAYDPEVWVGTEPTGEYVIESALDQTSYYYNTYEVYN